MSKCSNSFRIEKHTTPYFSCIFARDSIYSGIGYKNSLPWKLKDDIEYFKKVTTFNTEGKENVVIMGRKTWEGLLKPLSKRINIVVSKSIEKIEGVKVCKSLYDALYTASEYGRGRYIFVIGGVSLYEEAFNHPGLESIYETKVSTYDHDVPYDTFFSKPIPQNFKEVSYKKVKGEKSDLEFIQYNIVRETSENAYINIVKEIIDKGEERCDRTNIGTISLYGPQITFDISETFPLLSTKYVGLKTVFEELIWMLRGQTNNNTLKRKNVGIWTKNSDDHHKKMIGKGVSHIDGDLGEIYGYNWRSFGGEYFPVSYSEETEQNIKIEIEDKRHIGEGFDQIQYVINEIKNNPESRRILFSGWNPKVLENVCLPCCHVMCQFYISKKKYLHCKLYMRSNDVFLGAPFNIAQYSLLTYMIASMTGYTPGTLIYSLGDAHIYSNHLEQIKLQLLRPLRNLPTLKVISVPENIEDFEFSCFEISGNYPHPSIKGEMAV